MCSTYFPSKQVSTTLIQGRTPQHGMSGRLYPAPNCALAAVMHTLLSGMQAYLQFPVPLLLVPLCPHSHCLYHPSSPFIPILPASKPGKPPHPITPPSVPNGPSVSLCGHFSHQKVIVGMLPCPTPENCFRAGSTGLAFVLPAGCVMNE